jgi:protein-S-isoprenylcysteine O-methyltransferase Ste14
VIDRVRYFLAVARLVLLPAGLLFRARWWLLGSNLGVNWGLIAIAFVLYGAMTWLELQYWKELSISTAIGIPELSNGNDPAAALLKNGAYRTVRHPRYLSAGIGAIANTLVVNYVGTYVEILLLFPLGFAMLIFEERNWSNALETNTGSISARSLKSFHAGATSGFNQLRLRTAENGNRFAAILKVASRSLVYADLTIGTIANRTSARPGTVLVGGLHQGAADQASGRRR